MKKIILCLSALTLTMVGCQKEVTQGNLNQIGDSKQIGFATSTGSTRANDYNLASLQNDAGGFAVYALKSDGTMLFTKPAAAGDNNYKYATNVWAWGNIAGKEWPAADPAVYPLQFIASYPNIDFEANYDAMGDFTSPIVVAPLVEDQVDHLAAAPVQVAAKPFNGKAPLTFKHILSNIQFGIKAPAGMKVYITNVKIHNVDNAGATLKYDFKAGQWTGMPVAAATFASTYVHDVLVGTATNEKFQLINGSGQNPLPVQAIAAIGGNTLKLYPQNHATIADFAAFKAAGAAWDLAGGADAWPTQNAADALAAGAYLEISYALVDANGISVFGMINGTTIAGNTYTGDNRFLRVGYALNLDEITNAGDPLKIGKGWKPGMKYTYSIELGTSASTGGTILDNVLRDENGDVTTDPTPDIPGENPNKDSSLIGFDVAVTDWATGNAVDFQ